MMRNKQTVPLIIQNLTSINAPVADFLVKKIIGGSHSRPHCATLWANNS